VLDDKRLHDFTGGSPDSPAELRARYARLVAGSPNPAVSWLNWIVRLRGSGQAVGTVQATVTGGGGSAGGGRGTGDRLSAEVAWVIGRPWQGHGYAAEAAAGLAGWLLSEGATVITACIHPDHHASAGVAARAGLAGFMKTVAREIAHTGVTINAVLPGTHDTDRVRQTGAQLYDHWFEMKPTLSRAEFNRDAAQASVLDFCIDIGADPTPTKPNNDREAVIASITAFTELRIRQPDLVKDNVTLAVQRLREAVSELIKTSEDKDIGQELIECNRRLAELHCLRAQDGRAHRGPQRRRERISDSVTIQRRCPVTSFMSDRNWPRTAVPF
jgi:RimJ/RimL family protein N-acetyltransferase